MKELAPYVAPLLSSYFVFYFKLERFQVISHKVNRPIQDQFILEMWKEKTILKNRHLRSVIEMDIVVLCRDALFFCKIKF